MDFCSKRYGLLHVPSLAVVLNVEAQSERVGHALKAAVSPDGNPTAVAELSDRERTELAHRLTTEVHERRHFHDILLTPLGNLLFAFSLARSAAILLASQGLEQNRGRDVFLPLGPDAAGVRSELLEKVRALERDYAAACDSAKYSFEASATIMQLEAARRDLGDEVYDKLYKDFAKDPRYGTAVKAVWLFSGRVPRADRARLVTLMNRLILLTLSDNLKDRADPHDTVLATLLSRLLDAKPREILPALELVASKTWSAIEANLNLYGDYFAVSIQPVLERVLRLFPNPDGKIVAVYRQVLSEFKGVGDEMRAKVIARPDSYVSYEQYSNTEWCEPFVYSYPHSGETGPLAEKSAPTKHLSAAWRQFTLAYAPSGALMEQVDFLHPLKGLWLRNLETLLGVTFARRFAF